jgi:hypothetical protein
VEVATAAAWALAYGHSVVLAPNGIVPDVKGVEVTVGDAGSRTVIEPVTEGTSAWSVALYSSGSTRTACAYGFARWQLNQLAAWYRTIYRASSATAVVTHLPVAYNFTFIAGLYLAASIGAHLHLAESASAVFAGAAKLAGQHDRCVILGNPVLLSTPPPFRLPDNVLIDSGGAPLSTAAIGHYREHVADLREGYGLTETGSLTHFDTEGTPESAGTVGAAMPGVDTGIVEHGCQPRIAITTPVLGTPIAAPTATATGRLVTSDCGVIDSDGRLRVLGRSDDHAVAGLWPRDTLDLIGPLLGTACAQVHHPTPDTVHIRLRQPLPEPTLHALHARVAERIDQPVSAIAVDLAEGRLLHSHKLPQPATSRR